MKSIIFLFVFLVLVLKGVTAHPKVELKVLEKWITPNEPFTVVATTESKIPIYGIQVEISYDAKHIYIEDCEPGIRGVQILKGSLLNNNNSYMVLNEVNPFEEKIRFMATLLDLNKPIVGKGDIIRIPMVAKGIGAYNIKIEDIKFGNKLGQTIEKRIKKPSLEIVVKNKIFSSILYAFTLASMIIGLFYLLIRMKIIGKNNHFNC